MQCCERIFLRQRQRRIFRLAKGALIHSSWCVIRSAAEAKRSKPIRFSVHLPGFGLLLLVGFGIGFAEIGQEYVQHSVFVRFLHGPPFGDEGVPSQALLRCE